MNSKKIKKLINIEYVYPEPEDPHFQTKIYEKREFYYNKIPENKKKSSYKEVKEYRDKICGGRIALYTHQSFLSNFINPNTPYKGLLVFHGVGTGKTGVAISIAENFKNIVLKYNTKIYVLVPGPFLKEAFKDDIIKFTGGEYLKEAYNKYGYIDEQQKIAAKKNALKNAMQYYRIMTHRGFYKKVLGDKIKEVKEYDDGKKSKYRKNDTGEFERDLSTFDKIDSLDNTILIIDEAHRFTGNEHGDALKMIIKKSKNLKLLLLTATPMKNLGDDIIELINFLRPEKDKLRRDKIFNSQKNYLMDFKPGGDEYLKNMCSGYVSHYRGANPLLFAKRVDMGEIPPGLIFTKCIRCKMEKFQQNTYTIVSSNVEDTLERRSSAVANIVFPVLDKEKKKIIGAWGESGLNQVKSNLKTNKSAYLSLLNKNFFGNKIKDLDTILYQSNITDNITGLIFKEKYLKMFSSKFHRFLQNVNSLVAGKKGPQTAFVYSNLVKVGIDIIQEILLANGYLEFNEKMIYDITDDTVDYYTGKKYSEFKGDKSEFHPATFMKITGKSDDDLDDQIEIKKAMLDKFFNDSSNYQGKYMKFILGSKVMTEGITLENTGEVHILDAYYTLNVIEQVTGRAVRQCKHYKVTNESNPYPEVKIYKYVIRLDRGLSSEENLYRKAELKYLLIKKVERALKECSIDCPINYSGNVFQEEVKENKGCYKPQIGKEVPKGKKVCLSLCDFKECNYECYDKKLNLKYYDKHSLMYKKIKKDKLDYTTFNEELAKNEIKTTKNKIKDLYKLRYVYTLVEILSKVRNLYEGEQYELFEDFFVYQALDQMIPITENDFINFSDTIYDKYNIPGYLIYRDKYYIFQPFEQNELAPMFYRQTYNKELVRELSLYNYLKNSKILDKERTTVSLKLRKEKKEKYDFASNKDYYNERKENNIIGIIDAPSSTSGMKKDVFKIREKRAKILNKKRGTGIFSERGAVCYTSKDKSELKKIYALLNIKNYDKKHTRGDMCDNIRERLLYLEKYSKGKDIMTYMMIPYNHPAYIFPLNLYDRIAHVEEEFNNLQKASIKIKLNKKGQGIFEGVRNKAFDRFEVEFKYTKNLKPETKKLLDKYGFTCKGGKFTAIVE